MTNNISNNQQQTQNINKAVNFMEKWELEANEYSTALMPSVKIMDRETNRSRWIQKPWPRVKPVTERVYEMFYSKIVDPISQTYYPERDSQGNIIEPSDGKPRARQIISDIIRLKHADGNEYLYTNGILVGFNSFGSIVTYPYHK